MTQPGAAEKPILSGAIPAALPALVVQISVEALDRLVVPRGLRLPQREP